VYVLPAAALWQAVTRLDDEAEALLLQIAELRRHLGSNEALDDAERAAIAAQLAALEARGGGDSTGKGGRAARGGRGRRTARG
jgi:hypothetical protein